jgi:ATP-binding cassette, subfamily G (WHITE), member 2, SNQ2
MVLKMCGLENYADAIVGTLGVEHRKRTTIAVELAAKVSIHRQLQLINEGANIS